jgi:phosphonopyruvate decarboxylase
MLSREDAIKEIFEKHGTDAVYVTNTGYLSRAIYQIYPDNNNIFYMQGSMGLSPAIALGMASSTKKQVVALSGDGSLLMHMGITHTIRDYINEGNNNLHVYVLDNGCHESVGAYKCSNLENKYPGVTKIYKISNDGKTDRVGVECIPNAKKVREFITNE